MWKFLKKEDPNHLYDGIRFELKMARRMIMFFILVGLTILVVFWPYISIK